MEHYNLSEEVWSKLFSRLNEFSGIYSRNAVKIRHFIEGVFWILRTGAQWKALPPVYGNWRSIHKRFDAWSRKGIWGALFESFTIDHDGEWIMLDSTIVRAHPCAAAYEKNGNDKHGLGRSKGGFTTKIHALVDALGNPLRFCLTAGQRHDITQAPFLIQGFYNAAILADTAYDSQPFIQIMTEQNCLPVIPPRSNRKQIREYDTELYKERNLVERFFRKIKNFRRVFSRFEQKAQNFIAFIAFAATIIALI